MRNGTELGIIFFFFLVLLEKGCRQMNEGGREASCFCWRELRERIFTLFSCARNQTKWGIGVYIYLCARGSIVERARRGIMG